MKKKKYNILPEEGVPCPRCKLLSEVREHEQITSRILRQPYYFSRWFRCNNISCSTKIFMKEEFKVFNYEIQR